MVTKLSFNQTDSKEAIRYDPTYVKGFYRRGAAYVALNQLDLACQDFKQVCKLVPSDKDARSKYELTLKEFRLREFSKCIKVEDKRVEINVEDIVVESSYDGPKIEDAE